MLPCGICLLMIVLFHSTYYLEGFFPACCCILWYKSSKFTQVQKAGQLLMWLYEPKNTNRRETFIVGSSEELSSSRIIQNAIQ